MKAQYWTYDAMWDGLRELEQRYPDFMTVEVIGQSRDRVVGREHAGCEGVLRVKANAHLIDRKGFDNRQ